MGKIIGNWFYIVVLLCSGALNGAMTLRVLDQNGVPLEQVAVGNPFQLEVALTDVNSFSTYPTIRGIERFGVKNSGMRITTVNGHTSATYSYELRIDVPGEHLLGPAELTVGHTTFRSNSIAIRVDDETIAQTAVPAQKKQKYEPAFIRLTTDKQRAVEGERIGCKLRFYFTDPRIALKQLIMQESKQITRQPMRGPFTGTETINGITYDYAEWQWDAYVHAAGRHVIPAYGVDYEREIEQERNYWGGFARFFGNHVERKRIYSNAVSMQVDPLPITDGIQGVGTFSYLHVSAQPSVAKQGEGMIIAVELAGRGNMHEVNIAALQGMPSELRFYESKQSLIEPQTSTDLYKKRFEFVVQGLKTGSWDLPAQSFTYYDVEARAVRTIQSAPLTITIMPGVAPAALSLDDFTPNKKPVAALHEQGPWYPAAKAWKLSWLTIVLLIMLPIALLITRGMMMHFKKRVKVPYELIREKYAFSHAKARFAKLKQEQDVRRLYALFIELIASKCKTSLATITVPFIMMHLKNKAMAEDKVEKWNQFFKTITERAYAANKSEIDEELFKQAEQWLNDLQNIL